MSQVASEGRDVELDKRQIVKNCTTVLGCIDIVITMESAHQIPKCFLGLQFHKERRELIVPLMYESVMRL